MSKTLFPTEKWDNEVLPSVHSPLAERMRPRMLNEVIGQDHLLAKGKILREIVRSNKIPSLIFWGPPGVGKTTLARIISTETKSNFFSISAVLSGVREVKSMLAEARVQRRSLGKRTLLFVDEIHRFNKAQQDAFLPHVERGDVILLGATTENPSFEVISPLLSRSQVLVLYPLSDSQIVQILKRAVRDPKRGLGTWNLEVDETVLRKIAGFSEGDARVSLNSLELASHIAKLNCLEKPVITREIALESLQKKSLRYDKAGEEHYNFISALHKSLRNSDIDAALYWLGRMLEAGEDALYIVRRMIRFASEDVGVADPAALGYAVDAFQAVNFIGLPEGVLALAQLTVYLAQAPKSNAVYEAYEKVRQDVKHTRNDPVPMHLRNAVTSLMKDLGYGQGYRYAHSEKEGVAAIECLPKGLVGKKYYRPRQSGFEVKIGARLKELQRIRETKSKKIPD